MTRSFFDFIIHGRPDSKCWQKYPTVLTQKADEVVLVACLKNCLSHPAILDDLLQAQIFLQQHNIRLFTDGNGTVSIIYSQTF